MGFVTVCDSDVSAPWPSSRPLRAVDRQIRTAPPVSPPQPRRVTRQVQNTLSRGGNRCPISRGNGRFRLHVAAGCQQVPVLVAVFQIFGPARVLGVLL